MPLWLGLAIGAQFLSAVSVLIDKHIVARAQFLGQPIVYAFYVSLLSGFVFVFLPFGVVEWPSLAVFSYSVAAAGTFIGALFFLYSALKIAHASDVAPVVGAVSAMTTVLFASILLDGDFTVALLTPIAFLVVGTALISHFHFSRTAVWYVILGGIFFGVTALIMKFIFLETSFFNGFFWSRAMNVALALLLLLVPSVKAAIYHGGAKSSQHAKLLVIGNKIIGGSASVLTAFAISLGSVSVVNSLAGLQFVFLFFLTYIIAQVRHEKVERRFAGFGHTAIGVVCIVVGLAMLYILHSP